MSHHDQGKGFAELSRARASATPEPSLHRQPEPLPGLAEFEHDRALIRALLRYMRLVEDTPERHSHGVRVTEPHIKNNSLAFWGQ